MNVDPEILASLQEQEEELGGRGREGIPVGLYHAALSSEDSAVHTDGGGNPVLGVGMRILSGEQEGRMVSSRFWWFGNASADNDKSLEERTATTRRIAKQRLFSVLKWQLAGRDEPKDDEYRALSDIVQAMDSDNIAQVEGAMEAFFNVLDGTDFVIRVFQRKDRNDPDTKYTDFQPYDGGVQRSDSVERRTEKMLSAYENGLRQTATAVEAIEV